MATLVERTSPHISSLENHSSHESQPGLRVESIFCPADADSPFDTVDWELRSASIKDESGEVLFEQSDCEIPASWSQLATNVVVSKYFYGENGTGERERSVRQLLHRVTRPTGADKTAILPARRTASGFIAS